MSKVRTSITIDPATKERGESRAHELAYESFSAYLEALIAADADCRFAHYLVRDSGSIRYGVKAPDPEKPES